MAKLSLNPNPTFHAKVVIPIPGGDDADVVIEFKHKGKKELAEFLDSVKESGDADLLEGIVAGWDLDDEFNRDNIDRLVENYGASASAIAKIYFSELAGARVKN